MSQLHQYLILNRRDYFAIAEEYVMLNQIFQRETFLEKLSLWVDMLIYPVFLIVSIFLHKQEFSIFTVMTIHKVVSLWTDWIRYLELQYETHEWMNIVRSNDGPFISTNDPKYHMYVYADGMQRLNNAFPVLTKKGAKSL